MTDEIYMKEALKEAEKAYKKQEVPVGAIIVKNDKIIARAHNQREKQNDSSAHAEIMVLRKASKKIGSWRMHGCTMYVTLEPCPMCAGALIQSRMDRVVFGAYDNRGGCVESLYHLLDDKRFLHRVEYTGGVLKEECALILKRFFEMRRKGKRWDKSKNKE